LIIKNFKAYYDERKALKEILESNIFNKTKTFLTRNFSFDEYKSKIPVIGDGIYSNSNELIDLTIKKDLIPIFKIKEPLHNNIKSKQRKLVKETCENYKDIFKKRFHIEGFFGNVKNKLHCYVNASSYEVAKTLVYAKFLAWLLVVFYLFYFLKKNLIHAIFFIKKVLFLIFFIEHSQISLTRGIKFYILSIPKREAGFWGDD